MEQIMSAILTYVYLQGKKRGYKYMVHERIMGIAVFLSVLKFLEWLQGLHAKEIEDNLGDWGDGEDKVGDAQPKVLEHIIVTSPDRVLEPPAPTTRGAQDRLVNVGFEDGDLLVSIIGQGSRGDRCGGVFQQRALLLVWGSTLSKRGVGQEEGAGGVRVSTSAVLEGVPPTEVSGYGEKGSSSGLFCGVIA
ncbi:hypothetical protein BDR04DRAFT_1123157 [Suillus decipiens]|nr:hypothetical protein BDR04DRAFT_1123157 [Suillus decipiens]